MTLKNKLLFKKFFVHTLKKYALIFGIIAITAFIFEKWIEAFFFILCHDIIRPKFNYQLHFFNSEKLCLFITALVGIIGIIITIPTNIFLLSSIISSLIICGIGSLYQYNVNLIKKNIILNKQNSDLIDNLVIIKPFDLNLCTKEELIKRCRKFNLTSTETNRAVWLFIDKVTNDAFITLNSKIANKFIDYNTVYKIKQRLKNKLS